METSQLRGLCCTSEAGQQSSVHPPGEDLALINLIHLVSPKRNAHPQNAISDEIGRNQWPSGTQSQRWQLNNVGFLKIIVIVVLSRCF